MFCRFRDLQNHAVRARDDEAGTLADLLFDDEMWIIRYLELDGIEGRHVLVGPAAVAGVDCPGKNLRLGLTRQEVATRPGPGDGSPPSGPQSGGEALARSMREMLDYRVIGSDGELGHVADFVINADTWVFDGFVIALSHAGAAQQAVISPGWVNSVAPGEGAIHVDVNRAQIARDPAFDMATWQGQRRAD
jgi:hypothetical protein